METTTDLSHLNPVQRWVKKNSKKINQYQKERNQFQYKNNEEYRNKCRERAKEAYRKKQKAKGLEVKSRVKHTEENKDTSPQ